MNKRTLSIFIDESGDLGNYNTVTEYYILSFVFHDQRNDLSGHIDRLNNSLFVYSKDPFAIHTAPLIRREEMYQGMLPKDRRNIFTKLFFFSLNANINYKCFVFSKKNYQSTDTLLKHIMIELHDFFISKKEWLDKYDEIIVYYDNGQLPIKYAVTSLFALLFKSYEMRKVLPVDYRLFQTADMICTMYVMDAKYRNHPMSNSEKIIFNSKYDFYHDFFNPFKAK
ncbi:MAG: hypothetical protein J5666_06200, partial [Bacilli bacterium]|nr:hypothetical protein [Bacilli bacterium]